jgi:hypothetical protein
MVWGGGVIRQMDKRQEVIVRLTKALEFYAEPGNYHTIRFVADKFRGPFMDDFSEDHGDDDFYRLPMPGAIARRTLKEVTKELARSEMEDELALGALW